MWCGTHNNFCPQTIFSYIQVSTNGRSVAIKYCGWLIDWFVTEILTRKKKHNFLSQIFRCVVFGEFYKFFANDERVHSNINICGFIYVYGCSVYLYWWMCVIILFYCIPTVCSSDRRKRLTSASTFSFLCDSCVECMYRSLSFFWPCAYHTHNAAAYK